MKKGEICEGLVERYAFPNKGYIRAEDREICVKGALKGQRVRFSVKKLRKGAGEGKLLEVLERSPAEDVEPSCPHFGSCGGCAYQTMSYAHQLALKEEQVKMLLDRAVADYIWEGIKGSPVQEAYRNKMEFSFGDEYKEGPLALGMHKKGSFHDIVTVDHCRIVSGDYNGILRTVLDFYAEKQIPFYRKLQHRGVLRHLVVRQAACSGDILVNLVTTTQGGNGEHLETEALEEYLRLDELQERLLALPLSGRIVGFLHTCNDSLSDAVIPEKIVRRYGQDYLDEKLLGLTFKISPFSFFQTNSRGAEVLYETARAYAGETKDKVIFDLYSGTGTIAQMLAPVAKKVIGVEIVEEAVEAAKENAALNGLANCEFIAGDVLKVIDGIEDKPDIIVLDPPRDGIHPKALDKIIDFGVEEIVYISCKPTSLVRDLGILQARGYRVVKACAIDQFVYTLHCESIVRLCKSSDNPTAFPDNQH
ncbi:MAG: 23S rRNA (uracil(1939)-C(5))-methyltransferase RlmD [Bacteroidales bacterium]|nr:23S rRNA (uracil(1939)-C(5))-methyltransferase RlmD [Clostridium sp.]MCM1204778.1 23S rRNA (uracil(1939)-C(5))-methyltransferase RlmD [Bacteroidales bacterium]